MCAKITVKTKGKFRDHAFRTYAVFTYFVPPNTHMRAREPDMLVFRKILRTYEMHDPLFQKLC